MVYRIAGLLLLVPLLLPYLENLNLPQPSPDEVPPGYEQLAADMADNPDAIKWSGLLGAIGQYIIADGRTSDPQVKTMFDVLKLRDASFSAAIEPIAGGLVVKKHLSPRLTELGTGNEKLDASKRQAVADVFLNASKALNG